jgi:ATP-binding cassette subfamily B (MDR/TAP) protein 1
LVVQHDSEIIEVCKQVNLTNLINSLPQGIDTPCGERGLQLSGGERQRVALARAIIRKPSLLVLDEATSAIDAESEDSIKRVLYNLKAKTTIVMIAHRLSSIKEADCIYVFKGGQIIQSGKHQDIASIDGLYKNMIELQEL